jgi:hypothetical protein
MIYQSLHDVIIIIIFPSSHSINAIGPAPLQDRQQEGALLQNACIYCANPNINPYMLY